MSASAAGEPPAVLASVVQGRYILQTHVRGSSWAMPPSAGGQRPPQQQVSPKQSCPVRRCTWCHRMHGVPLSIRPPACVVVCIRSALSYSRCHEVRGVCPAAAGFSLGLGCYAISCALAPQLTICVGRFCSRALALSCSRPLAPSQRHAASANQLCRSADSIMTTYAYLGWSSNCFADVPAAALLHTAEFNTPAHEQACVMQVHCCSGRCSLPSQCQCPHHLHNSWQPQSGHPHSVPPSLHNLSRHQFQGAFAAPTGRHMPL